MCKCLIKQNSNTFVLEVLTLHSGELWITAAFLSLAEEMVKTRVGSEPSTPSTQLGFTNLMYTCDGELWDASTLDRAGGGFN